MSASLNPHLPALARGTARFVGDIPLPAGALHALPATSPHPHARFNRVDVAAALALPGVVAVLTAADLSVNEVGGILPGEPLLADGETHCVGEPYALVVAESEEAAWQGAAAVTADWEPLPAILDPRTAYAAGQLLGTERTFARGDVDAAWEQCSTVVSGSVRLGNAEHVAMETQCALATPTDLGGVHVHSSTQSPSTVQRTVAAVTGLPMHAVEIEVLRLGGGFGGKEDQATHWACMAALAALAVARPVRVRLDRREDFRFTGKRHPYEADYRLGLDDRGRFLAYAVQLFQDAGHAADLSPAVLDRSLFHATNAYHVENVRASAASCRTNMPPNTAFRGFGAPQGMFVFEAAIERAASQLGLPPEELRRLNLVSEGDVTHYGQRLESVRARACWDELDRRRPLEAVRREAISWNAGSSRYRKGVAVVPVCFGISFTNTMLNQAEALVHAYVDGTVVVSTGSVEMGQGVQGKIRRVVADTLGVREDGVQVSSTNTLRTANVSATAASAGADLNGGAAREACLTILRALRPVAAGMLGCGSAEVEFADGAARAPHAQAAIPWAQLVAGAYRQRVGLSALAHYATPEVWFDPVANTGKPFAYHVYGAALVEATVDVLLGTGRIDRVTAVHDCGDTLDEFTDRGQIEGAIVQGIGWMTTEEILHDSQGRLLTDTLSTYKIPDLRSAPEMEIHLLNAPNPVGLRGSKAVGEPPLVYGLGAWFALRDAVASWRPLVAMLPEVSTPLSSERIFALLHHPLESVGD